MGEDSLEEVTRELGGMSRSLPKVGGGWVEEVSCSFYFIFMNLFIYLFIFGCVGSLLLRMGFL